MAELWLAGIHLPEIAEKLGVSRQTVWKDTKAIEEESSASALLRSKRDAPGASRSLRKRSEPTGKRPTTARRTNRSRRGA